MYVCMYVNPARGSGQKSSRMLNTFFRPEALWSPVVSEIPDFLSCIPDSKDQNSGLRQQKFSGFQNSDSLTCGKPFAKYFIVPCLGLNIFATACLLLPRLPTLLRLELFH